MQEIMTVTISTGFIIFDLLFALGAAVLSFYVYYQYRYQYWKKKGVPYLEPKFPYGNNPFLFTKSPITGGEIKLWYDELKQRGHKFGGVYSFSKPVLVLTDPEYIKDILAKDFHHFVNRDLYVNEKHDPLGTNLLNIKDGGWRRLRQKFTPTFTSGKMKIMFNSVVKSSENMIDFLARCDKIADDVDIREVLASFTTDVIGSVAFGIDCNSFIDSQAEFRNHGRRVFQLNLMGIIQAVAIKTFPVLSEKLGLKFGNPETQKFFKKVIYDSIEYRKKNNIRRSDFLQILIDMNEESKDKDKTFTFEEIVSNSILFFTAGFDTSSTLMTYTLYELARNSDIQDKLREEIKRTLKKHNGQITYDCIQEMTYLKQCMEETLRIHPPSLALGRVCTKNYQLRDTDIVIEKGTSINISLIGLGRDPENYPDPMKYDPNRFSPEEMSKRHPFIHLPFGEGPRNCIGLRFGQMQAEIGLIQVLTNFKVKISPKTKVPLDYDLTFFLLKETETLYLNIEKI